MLVRQPDRRAAIVGGIEKIQYKLAGGATKQNHFCSRTFENTVWHCDGVYRALKARPDIKPDLIVGHSGFGSTLFLRELYPTVADHQLLRVLLPARTTPTPTWTSARTWAGRRAGAEVPARRCRNAMILLDLQNCQAGYTPTEFQKSRFPAEYQPKLETIFDGVDRAIYHGYDETLRPPVEQRGTARRSAGVDVPAGHARRHLRQPRVRVDARVRHLHAGGQADLRSSIPDVVFFVVGTDRIAYGGDENYIAPHKTFKEWVLAQDEYDLTQVRLRRPAPAGTSWAGCWRRATCTST